MFSKFQSLPSYFGGKRKLVKQIFKPIQKTEGVFIDAFLGGGSVSLYAKAKGYKVISNDISFRSYIIGRAIIANNSVKLETEDLARLFIKTKHDGFIRKNYCPKVFTSKIADFLDTAFANARTVENETKRHLLFHLLIKFILSCRQFGKFTHTRDTLDLEARKWEWPLRSKSHAPKNLRMIQNPMMTLKKLKDEINHGVFDNHQENEIHQKDVFDFPKKVSGDVVYFDPPYPGSSSYEVEYGILDNILAGKKLDNKPSPFSNKDADEFLERMFESAKHIPQWVISLGQNKEDVGVKPEKLLAMVQKHRKAEVQMLDHKWSVSNAGGRGQSDNIEYMIVTIRQGSGGTTRGTIGINKKISFIWYGKKYTGASLGNAEGGDMASKAAGQKNGDIAPAGNFGLWYRLTWPTTAGAVTANSTQVKSEGDTAA